MGTLEKEKKTARKKKSVEGSSAEDVDKSTKSRIFVDKRSDIRISGRQKKFLEQVKEKYGRRSFVEVIDLLVRDFQFLEELRDGLGCSNTEVYSIIRDNIPESAYKKQIAIFNQFQDQIAPYLDEDDLSEITQFFIKKINSNNGKEP